MKLIGDKLRGCLATVFIRRGRRRHPGVYVGGCDGKFTFISSGKCVAFSAWQVTLVDIIRIEWSLNYGTAVISIGNLIE